jgi:tRNA dimethylallyltransferase
VQEKKLIVIAGPTAVGKTSLAIKLAEQLKTEIVSADSRQFYGETEIGTAKPTPDELKKIKHHFINSLSIHQEYSVGDYEKDALLCIENLFKYHNHIILVGGSGLFINAVCEGLDVLPSGDKVIREHYEKLLLEKGIEPLQKELKEKDPAYYDVVDKQNPRRLARALEVINSTGMPYSYFRKKKPAKRNFSIVKIGLNIDKDSLRKRIDERVDNMISSGLLVESKRLYPYRNLNALNTVGYAEMFDFIEGKTDWGTTVQNIKTNTWHYAKRQLTWFKKDKEIKWFEASDEDAMIKYLDFTSKI